MAQSPEKVFRIGSVSASIFANQPSRSEQRVFRSISLQRSYKDGEETKYSPSLSLAHLPNAIEVLKMALAYVAPLEAEGNRNEA